MRSPLVHAQTRPIVGALLLCVLLALALPATANICPWGAEDSDGDGVEDSKDHCDTPPDAIAELDERGCAKQLVTVTNDAVILNERVYFETNKGTILERSGPVLDALFEALRALPEEERFEVGVDATSRGSYDVHLGLSQKRAQSVVAALVARGLDEERLVAKGYGDDRVRSQISACCQSAPFYLVRVERRASPPTAETESPAPPAPAAPQPDK